MYYYCLPNVKILIQFIVYEYIKDVQDITYQ